MSNEVVSFTKEQLHHLSTVLRLRPGDGVRCFNSWEGEFLVTFEGSSSPGRKGKMLRPPASRIGASCEVVMCGIKKKPGKMVVEKVTELGAGKVTIVTSDYTIGKGGSDAEKLKKTAEEATVQCERLDVPAIETDGNVLKYLEQRKGKAVVGVERGVDVRSLREALVDCSDEIEPVGLVVGPEGGWSEKEVKAFNEMDGVECVTLGGNVLRAETAAMAMTAGWAGWKVEMDV